jgi:hypothetical protein
VTLAEPYPALSLAVLAAPAAVSGFDGLPSTSLLETL